MGVTEYLTEVEPTILILVGFGLFVIPEPATSTLGVGLMLLGLAWWIQEWRSTPDVDGDDGQREALPPRP